MAASATPPLYAPLEGPIGTLYAELAERARAAGQFLPGTPGTLALRDRPGTGAYWYRRYYDTPGTPQVEAFVCPEADTEAYNSMRLRIEAAEWSQAQVRSLRQLGMQVADKDVARVLVELHNRELFGAGLAMVGTLAYMAWLNELGVKAAVSRTQDVDLARRLTLKLAAPVSFMDVMTTTRLGFVPIPGFTPKDHPTSVKRPGKEGLRVDLLMPGSELGKLVPVPEMDWHAQSIPHFDYVLTSPRRVSMLAGGQCVPVSAPAPERLAWHKLYSSTRRLHHDAAKADKDLRQAATLMAVLVERDNIDLAVSTKEVPTTVLDAARKRLPSLQVLLAPHPQALNEVKRALAAASPKRRARP